LFHEQPGAQADQRAGQDQGVKPLTRDPEKREMAERSAQNSTDER
jgi:hypothetical protein